MPVTERRESGLKAVIKLKPVSLKEESRTQTHTEERPREDTPVGQPRTEASGGTSLDLEHPASRTVRK